MATGDDGNSNDDDNNVGVTMTMTTMIATVQRATGYDDNGYLNGGGG
jgi:hypothetical protein